MHQIILEYFHSGVKWLRAPSRLVVALTIMLATSWYILNPSGHPYIDVPGSRLLFELPPFRSCVVTFRNPVTVKQYSVARANSPGTTVDEVTSRNTKDLDVYVTVLTMENLQYQQPPAMPGHSELYSVDILSESSLNFEIEALSIDNRPIDLKVVFNQNLKSKGEYVRFKYVRKDIADIIFSQNDSISNWILTVMFFGIVWLIYLLAWMESEAYLYSNRRFKRSVSALLGIQKMKLRRQDVFDKYVDHWAKWDARFRFLQALGPATGFILTVSSLIQALHPALGAANDLDAFLNGIHIAMISTFLGLLLRIVALEGARVNNKLLGRAELVFAETESFSQSD